MSLWFFGGCYLRQTWPNDVHWGATVYLKLHVSLLDDHFSVNLFGISGLRDGVYYFRPYNNAGNVFHIAVTRRLVNEAVGFLKRRCALCFEMIPVTTLCILGSPCWTLAFLETMCYGTKFTCSLRLGFQFSLAVVLWSVRIATSRWGMFIFHSVCIFVLGTRYCF